MASKMAKSGRKGSDNFVLIFNDVLTVILNKKSSFYDIIFGRPLKYSFTNPLKNNMKVQNFSLGLSGRQSQMFAN